MKFSKLLVQTPHHLVTCAHHKTFLILLNKLRLLWYIHAIDYVHLSAVSYIIIYYCHVAQNVLYSSLCYSLTPQNLKSLVHRKCKMVGLVVINCQAYFLHISISLLINLAWIESRESWLSLMKRIFQPINTLSTNDKEVLCNSSKVHLMILQLGSIYRQRITQELQILTVFIFAFVPIFLFIFYFTMTL